MINSVKYAELSELSYKNNLQFPGYKTHFVSNGSTQCYVLLSDLEQIVVFRGTEKNISDISTDLKLRKQDGIHRGFLAAYSSVIEGIYKLVDPKKKITFTGHSLGGALAILSSCLHGESESKAVAFGAPRVFGLSKARHYSKEKIFRYENAGDPVPYMPLYSWGYRHIGDCGYINENLQVVLNPAPFTPFMNMFFCSLSQKANSHSIVTYKEKLQRIHHV